MVVAQALFIPNSISDFRGEEIMPSGIVRVLAPTASTQRDDRDTDIDRQISEHDARIRSNPRDAVAYRERGSLHARKGELNHALKDLNQAVLLNPEDPLAACADCCCTP